MWHPPIALSPEEQNMAARTRKTRTFDVCPQRVPCTAAKLGQGRTLTIREDEPFQQTLRAKLRTKRGRAALRKHPGVEHALSHQ